RQLVVQDGAVPRVAAEAAGLLGPAVPVPPAMVQPGHQDGVLGDARFGVGVERVAPPGQGGLACQVGAQGGPVGIEVRGVGPGHEVRSPRFSDRSRNARTIVWCSGVSKEANSSASAYSSTPATARLTCIFSARLVLRTACGGCAASFSAIRRASSSSSPSGTARLARPSATAWSPGM